jgi:hypothetical protein
MRQVRVDGEEEQQLCNVVELLIIGTGSNNTKLTDMFTPIDKVILICPKQFS